MKRYGILLAVAVSLFGGLAVSAVPATALPPGVTCAGPTCFNDTDEPQTVFATEVCPMGPQFSVSTTVPPHGTGLLPAFACPNGQQPQGYLYN
ncbi:hypothetical protein LTV02_37955 [Nocardia yamanashiensis]|uniref:hypothetical protein n=1 Tax=Nocardia yamanashiensis TaxID=209247 RepID=UPI001E435222|nr:hypothetical protein [Nocardia yamanashiensis]UGT41640.1 hypothetical protein LTV02_37955 [Nocardia yamanashiensis]